MPSKRMLHPAIEKYLTELELAAKLCLGVCPNQILRDAEEHLVRDCEALLLVEPALKDEDVLDHFHKSFGEPDEVASSYANFSETAPSCIPARAADWRIHCTQCGRSAPAQSLGITRIYARSKGKRILGWCSECKTLRMLSLTRDLNRSGTIERLETLGKETGNSAFNRFRTWKTHSVPALLIAIIFLPMFVQVFPQPISVHAQVVTGSSKAPGLQNPPPGWEIVSNVELKDSQLAQFSKKLGLPLKSMFNTVVRFDNKNLQINSITTQKEADAEQLKTMLRKGKSNPRWVVRNATIVYEFVVRTPADAHIASKARYAFPILPPRRTYQVAFEAIPIQGEEAGTEPDARNQLFNLLIDSSANPAIPAKIETMAKRFRFGKEFDLVKDLQGSVITQWKSNNSQVSTQDDPECSHIKVLGAQSKFGMPLVNLTATISIDSSQKRKVDPQLKTSQLLEGNSRFPIESLELQRVVSKTISASDSDLIKLEKLLNWFSEPANIRYDGSTGSRYGTATVLKQHFGRCWDYADLFVTMARAAGLPSRQVYGWLHESEGHVWCDVIVDGHWQMVDPTTGTITGSDYLPFCISSDGEFPLLYASKVRIEF